MKNVVSKISTKIIKFVAIKASGSASVCGYHQPKEPTILKSMKGRS